MRDMVGHRILIAHLPAEMKVFHMKHVPEDRTLSESVDLVIPGVGAIVGMSMRIDDLIAAYKANRLDPTPSYWYTDQRKYMPARGYGLGTERFVMWLLGEDHTPTSATPPPPPPGTSTAASPQHRFYEESNLLNTALGLPQLKGDPNLQDARTINQYC